MSLLLDALKKAEQEKQKAREAEAAGAESEVQQQSEQKIVSDTSREQQSPEHIEAVHEKVDQVEKADDELTLIMDDDSAKPGFIEEPDQRDVVPEVAEPQLTPPIELPKASATTSTVSDEALQHLVYKINKKYRHRQKIAWGSLISVAVIILMTAGAYYYYGVLEEVHSLETKHKLAMRAVSAEPVKRIQKKLPAESSKAEAVVQSTQRKTKQKQAVAKKPTVKSAVKNSEFKRDFSIKKTKVEDPINALLQRAWLAYNKADYAVASQAYESVIRREPQNRDALLGMAAVAVKMADYKKAIASYRLLLKLDPRDQVAMAAMSNIEKQSTNSQDESKLKFMLQQQPTATHLNFALGNYYARRGRWPEAQAEYFKAWQGNSENADYVYNLAVSLDQLGKRNEALRFYKESLVLASQKNVGFSKADVEKRIEKISAK